MTGQSQARLHRGEGCFETDKVFGMHSCVSPDAQRTSMVVGFLNGKYESSPYENGKCRVI